MTPGTQPLRVLHVISGLGTGGAENFLFRLLSSLSAAVEGRVVSLGRGGGMVPKFRNAGIQLAELGLNEVMGKASLPVHGYRIARGICAWRPQIVQGWMNHGNLGAWMTRKFLFPSARLIWSIRQTIYDIGLERRGTQCAIRLQALLSAEPDEIICNSSTGFAQHRGLGFKGHRMRVIPNGFDVDRYRPRRDMRSTARALLGVSEEKVVVAMVARRHAMKDYPCFLKAMAMVAPELPLLQAVCIGPGVNSPGADTRALVESLSLESVCRLFDERADIERIYPGIDILCLTSAWGEGFPNVLGEAMACAIPCVATDVGDAAAIIGDCGVVVPPRSPASVAAGVLEILRMGYEARMQLGARARERIVGRFSMSAVADEYLRVYRGLVSPA